MEQLLKYLRPLKNRIHLKFIISTALTALTLALALDAVLVLFSKFRYVYGVFDIAAVLPVAILATALIMCQFMRPSDYKTARIADSLGYKERFVTSMEIMLKKNPSQLEQMVLDDAVNCAKNADFKALYGIKPERYMLIAPLAAALLFAAAYFVPIQPSEELAAQQEMHELLDESIKSMTEKIDTSNLTAKQKKEIKSELNSLKKELSKADNKSEAVNTIMKGQTKLKKIVENSENEQLKAIGSKLSQNKATQNIGEMLESGNIEQFNEEIKNLNDNLKNMTGDEIKELGKALKAAAQTSGIDEETKQLLDELGDTLQNELTDEQLAEVSQNLSEFSDKINELAKQNKDIRDAIEKLNKDLAKTSEELGGAATQSGSGTQQGQQGQPVQGQGMGQSQQGQSGGTQRGSGTIPNANVYTSNAQQYGDYDAELNGNGNDGTGDKIKTGTSGEKGEIVPYTDVYNEYKNEAMKNIEQDEIPYGVKDIVRDYFSSLE